MDEKVVADVLAEEEATTSIDDELKGQKEQQETDLGTDFHETVNAKIKCERSVSKDKSSLNEIKLPSSSDKSADVCKTNKSLTSVENSLKSELEVTDGEVASTQKNYGCNEHCGGSLLDSDSILNPLHLTAVVAEKPDRTVCFSVNEFIEKLTLSPSQPKMLDNETPCMICDHVETNMDTKSHHDEYLCHLIVEHKLVIADVKLIADLQSYAIYWKNRIKEESLDAFCSKIRTNTGAKDVGASDEYYLLCDALPEDKKIREELQLNNLKKLLLRQEFERKDESFGRKCPFCNKYFQGNRIILFNHLSQDHNFNIGHPDNIVNVREFLDEIEAKLNSLQCLFCERVFKDRMALREHMRKKSHRRLNPKNKEYDKFYIINYLELGKNWEVLQGESEKLDSSSDDWSGWYEDSQCAVCFFCTATFNEAEKVYEHMKEHHDFDFVTLRKEMPLSFYQQIKLINYIRREIHILRQKQGENIVDKVKESIKMSTLWNQPQYYFSTYEDDNMLCLLVDKDGLFEPEDTFVIGEDGIDCRSIVNNSVLTDLVVGGYFDE